MTRPRVILLVFAGRHANMALQAPLVQRILAEHPTAEYHVANLARNKVDAMHIRMMGGERVVVRNDFYRRRFPYVYADYARPEYEDCLFVKLDDDIVFLETERFGTFLDSVQELAGGIVSAATINNGACTKAFPHLWKEFPELGIPLLDVHKSNDYAELSHQYFIDNHAQLLNADNLVTQTQDWLSINCVGFDWPTLCGINAAIGTEPPPEIAGRPFHEWDRLGDEGAANMLPRYVAEGFTAAHLGYGPQEISVAQAERWRDAYRTIGQDYLECSSGASKLPVAASASAARSTPTPRAGAAKRAPSGSTRSASIATIGTTCEQ